MAQLTINGIVSNQVPSKDGKKNYLTIFDLDTGESIKVGAPVVLEPAQLRVPLVLAFQGFSAKRGDNGFYFVADGLSGSAVKATK